MSKKREVLFYRIWEDGGRDYGHLLIPADTKRRRLHKTVRRVVAEEIVWAGAEPVEVGYYAEVPPGDEELGPQKFYATGTSGQLLKRFGRAVCLRVMKNPVNFSAADPLNYAIINCPTLGIGLYRWGSKPRKAEYVLFSHQGHADSFHGIEGRDAAIAKLLRMVKSGKTYFAEFRSSYAHEQIPRDVLLGKRVKKLSTLVYHSGRQERKKRGK